MYSVKLNCSSNSRVPFYATPGSAGVDLINAMDNIVTLHPGERRLFKTGLSMEIPENMEAQVRSRSGLALKYGIVVLNSPGTIDSDYRGEIGVILYNSSFDSYDVTPGDKIAQLVFAEVKKIQFKVSNTSDITETERGTGGFGSTGFA